MPVRHGAYYPTDIKLLIEMSQIASLFFVFMKIGAFTFGGGWAMIGIMEREIVENHSWLTREEFLDLLAVAQSMPGILAVNIAVSVGDRLQGLKGSVSAAAGSIIPSFVIILAIAIFLTPDTIKNNATLTHIFMGIRPAVVALIIAPVITTAKAAGITWKTIAIPIVVAVAIYSGLPVVSNPIVFVVAGALFGYIFYCRRQFDKRKEAQGQ